MSANLDIADLKALRKELTDGINEIRTKIEDAFSDRMILSNQYLKLKDKVGELELVELKLQAEISRQELDFILRTNSDSPKNQIKKATSNLKAVARKIENFDDVLSGIADVISIFGNITKAIATGGFLSLPM
jgi:lipid II:glycine glycyltransferase (peptidoglycan interpeptide bridge formation enzyme)